MPRVSPGLVASLTVVIATLDGPNDGDFRWSIVVSEHRRGADVAAAIEGPLATAEDGDVQLWIREVDDAAHDAATGLGFAPYRDLWQLRCDLPAAPSGLTTRAFTLDDLDAFVQVNNRAFHWHPEQGGLTHAAVERTMAEPWFSADGFRLLHDAETDALVGYCWTKIHRDVEPNLGEIYVIAIDPDHHGRGLGKPMTLAGLEWLAEQGLADGMLYVESDNEPANATYEAIGFRRHHTDRAYALRR